MNWFWDPPWALNSGGLVKNWEHFSPSVCTFLAFIKFLHLLLSNYGLKWEWNTFTHPLQNKKIGDADFMLLFCVIVLTESVCSKRFVNCCIGGYYCG